VGDHPCPDGTEIPGLVTNGHVDITSKYICGSPSGLGTSYNITTDYNGNPLMDNQTYIVGIAAFDQVYNLGPLSQLQCIAPQPTNSFFPTYCMDGGAGCVGGCGSCNVGSRTDPIWPALGVAALAAVGLAVRHDRRRRRRGVR
jgi:hypothetical protein